MITLFVILSQCVPVLMAAPPSTTMWLSRLSEVFLFYFMFYFLLAYWMCTVMYVYFVPGIHTWSIDTSFQPVDRAAMMSWPRMELMSRPEPRESALSPYFRYEAR